MGTERLRCLINKGLIENSVNEMKDTNCCIIKDVKFLV